MRVEGRRGKAGATRIRHNPSREVKVRLDPARNTGSARQPVRSLGVWRAPHAVDAFTLPVFAGLDLQRGQTEQLYPRARTLNPAPGRCRGDVMFCLVI